MYPELRLGDNLEEFVKCTKAAGKCDKPMREIRHQRLALVHTGHFMQLGQPFVCHLPAKQRTRYDPNHFSSTGQYRICHHSHQPHASPSIDQSQPTSKHLLTKRTCRLSILLAHPRIRPGKHTNTPHAYHLLSLKLRRKTTRTQYYCIPSTFILIKKTRYAISR